MKSPSAIIFDLDGTLVNSEPLHNIVEAKLWKAEGVEMTDEDFEDGCGMTEHAFNHHIAKKYGIDQARTDALFEKKKKQFNDVLKHEDIPTVDGAVDLVKFAASKYPCAAASSSRKDVLKTIIEKIGLSEELKVQASADDVPPDQGKPHPAIFLLAAEKLGVDPSDCIAIEDSFNGVTSAKAASMTVIAYRNPESGEQDLSGADHIVERMSDAIDLLQSQIF